MSNNDSAEELEGLKISANTVRYLLECVNVLRIISEQSSVILDALDEPVARRRLELAGINFARKFEERSGIFTKVMYVEHRLRVWQVWKVDGESCVYAVTRSEVRNAAGNGNSCSREDDDFL